MFRREKIFNEKLLALRQKKVEVVRTVSALHQEYYQIHFFLRISAIPPLDCLVEMDPEEFPET